MRTFKLLLKEVKQENKWGVIDKDEIKIGTVAFPFKGKVDDELITFKKGDEVHYQYGTPAKIDGEDFVLVSLTSIVSKK